MVLTNDMEKVEGKIKIKRKGGSITKRKSTRPEKKGGRRKGEERKGEEREEEGREERGREGKKYRGEGVREEED